MSKTKPDNDVTWAEGASPGDVTDPSGGLRSAGYPENAPLPHDEFNAILQRLGDHIDALERGVGAFSNMTDAGNFLDEGEAGIIDSYDESLGVMAPTHSIVGTYDTDTDDILIASNGVYVAVVEIDSTTADESTLRVFEWDLTEVASVTYTPSIDLILGLDWCGDRLIVSRLDGSSQTQYDVFDTPETTLASPDRTYSTTGFMAAPRATSIDRFYITDPADNTNLIAVDPSDLSEYSYTGSTDAYGNGTGYANGTHVVVPANNGSQIVGKLLRDTGTSLIAQATTEIETFEDSEAQFRANDEQTLLTARSFNGSQHDIYFTLTAFNGAKDFGDDLLTGTSTVEGDYDVEVNGAWMVYKLPDDGTFQRTLWAQRMSATAPAFRGEMGVSASNSLAFSTPGPMGDLGELQGIALAPDAAYVVGIPGASGNDAIYRLQLPGPVRVEKSESSTGLYLHDLSS